MELNNNYKETSTRFIGISFDLSNNVISQYMQSYNGRDVARFKLYQNMPYKMHKPIFSFYDYLNIDDFKLWTIKSKIKL